MKKRKNDDTQSGQSKLLKFFHKVDVVHKSDESLSEVSTQKRCNRIPCGLKDAEEKEWSHYLDGKTSNAISISKKASNSPGNGKVIEDDLSMPNTSTQDIIPLTPNVSQKDISRLRLCKSKAELTFKFPKKNEKGHVSPEATSTIDNILTVRDIINEDNLPNIKTEKYPEKRDTITCSRLSTSENEEILESSIITTDNSSYCLNEQENIPDEVDPKQSNQNDNDIRDSNIMKSSSPLQNLKCKFEIANDIVEEYMEELLEDWDFTSCSQILEHGSKELHLDSVQRCKVISVSDGPSCNSKVLELSSTERDEIARCELYGSWAFGFKGQPGDVINIRCESKSQGTWLLGDETHKPSGNMGFIVEHPDMLIAGTSVVGSLFCPRKSVLADRFQGYESASPPPSLLNDPSTILNEISPIDVKPQNSARVMLIGCVVHELLQKSLKDSLHTVGDITKAASEILHSHKMAEDMYAAQVEMADIKKEVMSFVANIVKFMNYFVMGSNDKDSGTSWGKKDSKNDVSEWKGSICEVKDIEENLWVPSVGLKGKIDVTVQVKIHPRNGKGKLNSKEIPLELKTGRSSYSPEHQGQIILYCIMMSALAAEIVSDSSLVESGLLLYLREESMREIRAGKREIRDLILLRNELAHYLSRGPIINDEEDLKKISNQKIIKSDHNKYKLPISLPELPKPINHKRACSNCPYLTLCSTHLKCNNDLNNISSNHPMSSLAPQALKHLKSSHLDYFVYWSSLVYLESKECASDNKTHFLWTLGASEREQLGTCLSHLTVKEVKYVSGIEKEKDKTVFVEGYAHNFIRAKKSTPSLESTHKYSTFSNSNLKSTAFNIGDLVILSSDKRIAISFGNIISIKQDKICVCFDRDVTSRHGEGPFHLDKYDVYNSSGFLLTSLALLLEDNWSAARLRELIIEKREPQFVKKLDGRMIIKCSPVLKKLNHCQTRAVLRTLSAKDYILIRGLPGTGKTATIVAMVHVYITMGKSILLTGHSHSSVDNVMKRLVDEGLGDKLIRLGKSGSQINEQIKPFMESVLTKNCHSPKEIEQVYNSKMIVGVTCMGSTHPLLCNRAFDVCIVDEAGQILLPVTLRPILSAKVFVLVGDPQQLPPVVKGKHARAIGFEETLFDSLDSSEATVTLDMQYRMNSVITKLANDLSYGSSLVCANEVVANSTVNIPMHKDLSDHYKEDQWIHTVISRDLNDSVIFIDTGNTYDLGKQELVKKIMDENNLPLQSDQFCKYMNVCEAFLVKYIVCAFITGGVLPSKIGIMAPYKDQVDLLKRVIEAEPKNFSVEINTVDQLQGREKEIIIYSFTRSGIPSENISKTKELQLLSNKQRLTVAVTRAKAKLICVGHLEILKTYSILNNFISFISEKHKISLRDGVDGFSWSKIYRINN